jgi:molybdenum cofactor cytidylyltransferase
MSKAIIIISAGSSSRLGRPKQLVDYKGNKLINHILKECLASKLGDVYLLLGANKDIIETQLSPGDYQLLHNPDWKKGMGNSISKAVREISESNRYEGIYIVLSDQIFLDHHLLKTIDKKREENPDHIVISQYTEGKGPPSYFPQQYFSELCDLDGDDGAKKVVRSHSDKIIYVNFEKGNIDIDTPEDLKHLH